MGTWAAVMQAWWESLGGRIIWLAAVTTAIGFLLRTKPVRWVWGKLVAEPMSAWSRGIVGEVVDEKIALPNGGASVRDHLDRMSVQHTEMRESIDAVKQWTEEAVEKSQERDEMLEGRFDEVNGRIDVLCSEVVDLKSNRKKDVA